MFGYYLLVFEPLIHTRLRHATTPGQADGL